MTVKLSVLGTGYLGVTHAAGLAELGFEVIGLDVDRRKIDRLRAGRTPFYEPGLGELVRAHTASGRLRFTTAFAEVAAWADVHFLTVGTPQSADGDAADVSFLDAAVDALAPHLTRPCLVVGKSTVPVGTAARLAARLASLAPAGAAAELAWNPEFLREGLAVADTLRPDRIVAGVASERAERLLREVYRQAIAAGTPFLVTDLPTAELVKVAANAFLATKISFINAVSEICDAAGADVRTLARAIGHDERIGHAFLGAGVGFGGGCLPKDIRAFRARARELGSQSLIGLLTEVERTNLRSRARVLELARESVNGELAGRRVAVLGAAFKPGTGDVRDSPALAVASAAARDGAKVVVYDPMAGVTGAAACPELEFVTSMRSAVTGADVVLLLTEWDEFRRADPGEMAGWAAGLALVDGRGVVDHAVWRAAGWTVRAPGRPTAAPRLPLDTAA